MTFAQAMTIAARSYFVQLLDECDGCISEVARRSGCNRQNIYRLFDSLGLHPRPKTYGVVREFKEWSGTWNRRTKESSPVS
jgi:DNA-binding NtrC family response regulator